MRENMEKQIFVMIQAAVKLGFQKKIDLLNGKKPQGKQIGTKL